MDPHQARRLLSLKLKASALEIKQAFRARAHQCHPDKNPSAEAEALFQQITEAYDFLNLKFPEGFDFSPAAEAANTPDPTKPGDDLFSDLFNLTAREKVLAYFHPHRLPVTIETWRDGKLFEQQKVACFVCCETCQGQGQNQGHSTLCTYCFGAGQIKSEEGLKKITKLCPQCRGLGRKVTQACLACQGLGYVQKPFALSFKLPPQSALDEPFPLTGQPKNSSEDKVFYARIALKNHDYFRVANSQVLCELPLDIDVAAYGGNVIIPTIWGPAEIQLGPGIQNGEVVLLKEHGLPHAPGRRDFQKMTVVLAGTQGYKRAVRRLKRMMKRLEQNRLDPQSFWEKWGVF